jgi:hypothetical protein
MRFDRDYFGPEGLTAEDASYQTSRYADLRARLFADAYYRVWGAPDEPPLPTYAVTLGRALAGLRLRRSHWRFQRAALRSVLSRADWRPGREGRGYRRLLHPNGVCLFGTWEIDPEAGDAYTGCFRGGSRALIIGRYSTCCTETRGGRCRSLSLVGKLFPTTDPDHPQSVETANFITQEDIGGSRTRSIDEAVLLNAPNVSPWARGLGLPVLLVTGIVLARADAETTIRQVYPVAELGKPPGARTLAPAFMRLQVERDEERPARRERGLDLRHEVLGRIYDPGDPLPKRSLRFSIEVSDHGRSYGRLVVRRRFRDWRRIGRIVFTEAVASYSGDFLLHFQHPPWRRDRNDPSTLARQAR